MLLAIRNIAHDRTRFLLTVTGIAFSAFLMLFQGSLLAGFERASSRVIDSVDTDIWVMAHGVQAFDFSPPLPSDYYGKIRGVPGVRSVRRIASGVAFWQLPNGSRKTVILIGGDNEIEGEYPVNRRSVTLPVLDPDDALVDVSDMDALGLSQLPTEVEVNSRRRHVRRAVLGFGSFLGSPYVFGRLDDARRGLGLGEDGAMFLLLKVNQQEEIAAVRQAIQQRAPELDILTKEQFSARAQHYWTMQTGAGGALLTAAVLGFIVGVLIVSQTVYATTMENLEEFATLKALGASSWFIVRIVATQALLSTVLGSAIGMVIAFPIMSLARHAISWIYTPWQLVVALVAATLLLAALASITAARAAIAIEPGRVFRA
jgi:putative ABC transport system permease protein